MARPFLFILAALLTPPIKAINSMTIQVVNGNCNAPSNTSYIVDEGTCFQLPSPGTGVYVESLCSQYFVWLFNTADCTPTPWREVGPPCCIGGICLSFLHAYPVNAVGFNCTGDEFTALATADSSGTSVQVQSSTTYASSTGISLSSTTVATLAGPASTTASSPTSMSPPTASNTGSGSSSGLSQSDKIAIGVGLGVGIPPIILGLVSLILVRHRRERE